MQPTTKEKLESGKPTDGNQGKGHGAASSAEQTSHSASDESQLGVSGNSEASRVAEVVDQSKQIITGAYETASKTVKDTYDKTSRTVNETYGRVKSYSRENPGAVTLIAFGAGIGVAMLLFGSRNPRNRARRIVPPVINALRDVVSTLLR
jgi:adenine-specific DNA methylase